MSETAQKEQGRRLSTLFVGMLAGVLLAATAITAQGNDLRPTRTTNVADLAAEAQARNEELKTRIADLRADNERLAQQQEPVQPTTVDPDLELAAGVTPVAGPAVSVTLSDAPADYQPPGVDGDLLVIHEQDVQTFVNALWAGGAEAMTIQGKRVVATTAVKCVGNTIVLEGVPYAPPYVIIAIGDQTAMETSLANDDGAQIFQQYVTIHKLGYSQQRIAEITMPAYTGPMPDTATVHR